MADVSAIFGILLLLAIVFPGLMFTVWLLFPERVTQAEAILRNARGRSFAAGLGSLAVVLIPVLLNSAAGVGQLIGWLLTAAGLGLASTGTAGLALLMGRQPSLVAGGGLGAAAQSNRDDAAAPSSSTATGVAGPVARHNTSPCRLISITTIDSSSGIASA